MRRFITPVDSLTLHTEPDDQRDRFAQQTATADRMWVCEVRDELLTDGSFVVISPLGSVAGDGLAARAASDAVAESGIGIAKQIGDVPDGQTSESVAAKVGSSLESAQ